MTDSVNSPPWINKDFFTTVVKHHSSDVNASVIDFVIKPSLSPLGEHFVSSMFRVEINFSTTLQAVNTLSVVIKIPPTNGAQVDFVESSPLFVTEQEMYKGPLDEIKTLLDSVGDFSHIQPKLIYQSTKPCRVIVMEDLGESGYTKITQPLENYEDSRLVFQRLAKFHAAGFFLSKEKKIDFSHFKQSMFHMEAPIIREKFLLEPIDTLAEVLESWGGYEEYVEKLKTYRNTFLERGQKLYEPDVNGYNVLNHGDFHIKNLLFKQNEDKIEDLYFLDFQVSVFASPCVDLYYAFYNSISDENRRTRRDEIIHDYHLEFASSLKRFGYIGKVPSLLDLQMDLIKHGQMEVLKCIAFKIFFYIDAANAQNDEVIGSSESKNIKIKIFNDPRYQNFIKAELPRLARMGFL